MVVVQLQAEVIAQGIELVVGGLGNEPTAHLTGAGIGHPFMPSQTIVPQALGQHRHVKGRIVGHQHPLFQNGTYGLPQLGKGGLMGHHLRGNPGELHVEGLKLFLRIDQGIELLHHLSPLHHGNTNRAHTVVEGVGGLYIKGNNSLGHLSQASLYVFSLPAILPQIFRPVYLTAVPATGLPGIPPAQISLLSPGDA